MTLRRALFIVALVIPPTLGLVEATAFGWLRYEWSSTAMLTVFGVYAAWAALLGMTAQAASKWWRRKRATPVREAHAPRPGAPCLAPPPLEGFVGREDEIRRLERALKPGRIPVIVGVVGIGGIGKTELAKVVAHRVAGRYADGVLWADCLHQELETIADLWASEYGVQLTGDGFDDKAAAWQSLIKGKESLLIFDDVQPGQGIEALLPRPGRNMVLITTRDGHHHALRSVESVELNQLSANDAMRLAGEVLREKSVEVQAGDAERFFESVAYLPLAMSIGLHTARDREWSLVELNQQMERAGAIRPVDESGVCKSVRATFQTAWHNLSPDLQQAFAALAVFNRGPSFDTAAMAAVLNAEEPEVLGLLNRLAGRSLLRGVGERRWTLHPLLREFVVERLPAEHAAWGRMAAHYVQVAGVADGLYLRGGEELLRGLSLFSLEWAHIEAGQAWAAARAEADDEAAMLCSSYPSAAVYCLTLRLHPREWVVWLEAAARAARRLGDRASESNHLGNLGSAYAGLGEVRVAIRHYRQALEIAREMGDRQREGNRLGKLGLAYAELGEVREAIRYYREALEIAREMGDRWWEGSRLHNLGTAYCRLGELREAIGYYDQALEIAREIGDRRGESNRLVNLASAYAELGAVREAIAYYEEALEIARAIGDRRGESNRLGDLGTACAQLGQVREAIRYHEQALEIAREIGDRRTEGNHLGNLGARYGELGAVREAMACHEQGLEVAREIGDGRMQADRLEKLGRAHAELGEVREAIGYYEQGLKVAGEIGDRQMEGDWLEKLGRAHAELGEVREAIGYYERALEVAREIGERGTEGERLDRLGNAYYRLGEVKEAIGHYEQAIEIAREVGNRWRERAGLGALGRAYAALGALTEAMRYQEQALQIAREIGDRQGEGHSLGNLGLAYAALGEFWEAIGHYEEVLDIAREIGDRGMEGNALGQLGLTYAALGEVKGAIGYYERGLEIARAIGDRLGEGARLANMGQAYMRLGDTARARHCWEEALGIYQAMEDPNADRVRRWLDELTSQVVAPSA